MIKFFLKTLSWLIIDERGRITTKYILRISFVIIAFYIFLDEYFYNLFSKRSEKKALLRESQDRAYGVENIDLSKLTDNELSEMTAIFRSKIENDNVINIDDIIVEAFATAKEAAKRVLNIKFDQHQIFCEIACISNSVSGSEHSLLECSKVGNSVLSSYFFAITGQAHIVCESEDEVVTTSKYMDKVFKFLGLSTGCVFHDMNEDIRKQQYDYDVIYYSKSSQKIVTSEISHKRFI